MMKRVCGLIFTLIFGCFSGTSGQNLVAGKVTDQKGKPLPGAAVQIRDSYDGATADSTGKYRFETSETGDKTLLVTMTGFGTVEEKITIGNSPVEKNISLKETITELAAVVISAGSFEASDKKKVPSSARWIL